MSDVPPKSDRQALEALHTWKRLVELKLDPVIGQFGVAHLKEINRRIFQDLPGLGFSDVFPGENEQKGIPAMSLNRSPIKTQIRVNAALDMIDQADDPLKVRFTVAYAIGYIDALYDERLISLDGAELYRQDAYARRRVILAMFGVTLGSDEP